MYIHYQSKVSGHPKKIYISHPKSGILNKNVKRHVDLFRTTCWLQQKLIKSVEIKVYVVKS